MRQSSRGRTSGLGQKTGSFWTSGGSKDLLLIKLFSSVYLRLAEILMVSVPSWTWQPSRYRKGIVIRIKPTSFVLQANKNIFFFSWNLLLFSISNCKGIGPPVSGGGPNGPNTVTSPKPPPIAETARPEETTEVATATTKTETATELDLVALGINKENVTSGDLCKLVGGYLILGALVPPNSLVTKSQLCFV